MNQPLRYVLISAFISQLWVSCGDSATSDKTSTADSTAMTDTMVQETVVPPSTIVTTPENIVIVRYEVSDYAKWQALYDTRDSMRLANGLHSYVLGRGVEDTNWILVALKTDDVDKAKAFTKTAGLKSALQKGFVKGTPEFIFTNVVYQDMSPNMSDLRSMTFFKVKDFDAWKSSFEAHRQTRIDNGLTDRAYGHEVDNKNSVILVVGVNDSTKAEAFWTSDLIKKLRAESGVEGPVKRFVYRVIKKY